MDINLVFPPHILNRTEIWALGAGGLLSLALSFLSVFSLPDLKAEFFAFRFFHPPVIQGFPFARVAMIFMT